MSRRSRSYSVGDGEGRISGSQLRRASKDTKLQVMKAWFYENYEDPVNCLPYESAEGGYQYIYGGPYEPSEVLQDEFGGFVPDNLIEKLASDLSDISFEWSGNPDLYPPDDYLYESVLPLSPAYPSLEAALSTTRKVADKRMAEDLYAFVLRLLFRSAEGG